MNDKQSSDVTKAQASTPVIRSRGLDPLFTMVADMEEMMERTLGRRWPVGRSLPRILDTSVGWAPLVDMYEEGDQIVVKAELAGISKDDIEVTLEAGDLVIKGAATIDEVRIRVWLWSSLSTPIPTTVLPAPQGMTITPLPPCADPAAWKTSTASCW